MSRHVPADGFAPQPPARPAPGGRETGHRVKPGKCSGLAATGQLVQSYGRPHVALTDGLLMVKDVGGTMLCLDVGE